MKKATLLELFGGIVGWIWLLTIPCSLWFFFAALFTDAPWSRFFWSFSIGFVAKGLLRFAEAEKQRVIAQDPTAAELRWASFQVEHPSRLHSEPPSLSEAERVSYWLEVTAHPPVKGFQELCATLTSGGQQAVEKSAANLAVGCEMLLQKQGALVAERERRRASLILQQNYTGQVSGDLAHLGDNDRGEVVTQLANGLAYERLLLRTNRDRGVVRQRLATVDHSLLIKL